MFKKLFWKLRSLFKAGKELLTENAEKAVKIVQIVKTVIDSPAVDLVTALTPFNDERIVSITREALSYTLNVLSVSRYENEQEQLKAISEILEKASPQFKKLFYRELAASLAYALNDGKITAWEAFTLTQTVYRLIKEEKNEQVNS